MATVKPSHDDHERLNRAPVTRLYPSTSGPLAPRSSNNTSAFTRIRTRPSHRPPANMRDEADPGQSRSASSRFVKTFQEKLGHEGEDDDEEEEEEEDDEVDYDNESGDGEDDEEDQSDGTDETEEGDNVDTFESLPTVKPFRALKRNATGISKELASAHERIKNLETGLRGYKIGLDARLDSLAHKQSSRPHRQHRPPTRRDASSPPLPLEDTAFEVQYFLWLSREEKDHCMQLNICFRSRYSSIVANSSGIFNNSDCSVVSTTSSDNFSLCSETSPLSRLADRSHDYAEGSARFAGFFVHYAGTTAYLPQKVLPSKSSLFDAMFPPAPPLPIVASPSVALPATNTPTPSSAPAVVALPSVTPSTSSSLFHAGLESCVPTRHLLPASSPAAPSIQPVAVLPNVALVAPTIVSPTAALPSRQRTNAQQLQALAADMDSNNDTAISCRPRQVMPRGFTPSWTR
ncbi:uncharacterized protein MYCGRDRAFT_98094 [Zymoseptoria tritici IPO323]|uniref:Uncharacterized protein n=1 Tax=Zymoseptoria tritici (strain CBS 115943 / IPO323) TaxID=336722 RepID=F9XSA4_ZYMTI|nr:uncharacterized protein MYCGRDRAFT_98094 [Zymoseptoria tritici IPO323]EGP81833.1 hypothetical protein MYCGRDRAFT_98094 [Zymoseptoria tritici IPO323]